jgi:hypothetical protein
MQKTSAKRQVKSKPSKPKKIQSWRKKIDWSAAGRKAAETRRKNQKNGKARKIVKQNKSKKKQPKTQSVKQVKQHGKRKTVGAFGNYRVNRDELVAELKKSKKTEFAPTEVVSLTWNVIKKASAKQ